MLAQAAIQAVVRWKIKNLDFRFRSNDQKHKVVYKSALAKSLRLLAKGVQ